MFSFTHFLFEKMRKFIISANKIISVEAYMVVGYPILRLSKGLQVQFFIFSWVKYESPKTVCVASLQYKYQLPYFDIFICILFV